MLEKFSAQNKFSRVSVSGKDELDSAAYMRRKGSQTRLTGTASAVAKRRDSQSEMQNKDVKRFVIVAPEQVSSNCSVTTTFVVMHMGVWSKQIQPEQNAQANCTRSRNYATPQEKNFRTLPFVTDMEHMVQKNSSRFFFHLSDVAFLTNGAQTISRGQQFGQRIQLWWFR